MSKDTRKTQMVWLLGLTALTLVPVYILIGWQTGGHSAQDIDALFWKVEAGAWGLRALVESWALIYLFQTVTQIQRSSRILVIFEIALISLVALTVGLVIVANGDKQALANGLPKPLYWLWAFGVAAFAPLMMGSVGFAFKVHQPVKEVIELPPNSLDLRLDLLTQRLDELENRPSQPSNAVVDRRQRVTNYLGEGLTQRQMVELEGVSEGTIKNDVKAIRLNGK